MFCNCYNYMKTRVKWTADFILLALKATTALYRVSQCTGTYFLISCVLIINWILFQNFCAETMEGRWIISIHVTMKKIKHNIRHKKLLKHPPSCAHQTTCSKFALAKWCRSWNMAWLVATHILRNLLVETIATPPFVFECPYQNFWIDH